MPNIIIKDRTRLVKMQKDIIRQVSKSNKHGTDSKMKDRIQDYKQVSREHGLSARSELG